MTDTSDRPADLRQQPGVCPTCDGENIWLLVYEDQDMEPVLFSNHGADEAAREAFEHAATKWTVRLFKCVAQDGYGPGTGQQLSAIDKYNADLGRALRAAGVGQQPAQPGSGKAVRERLRLIQQRMESGGHYGFKQDIWQAAGEEIDRLQSALTAANQHVRILQEQQEEYGRERAAERGKLAVWMIQHGFITGHGDTIDDLLAELGSQVDERAQRLTAVERDFPEGA